MFGWAATALFAAGSAVFAMHWNERRSFDYNDKGRYFDEQQGVVLHEQAVAIYAVLAIGFGLFAIVSLMMTRRR